MPSWQCQQELLMMKKAAELQRALDSDRMGYASTWYGSTENAAAARSDALGAEPITAVTA